MSNKMFIDIIARDKTKQGLNFVQKRLNSVKSSVFSLRGALIGLGAGAVVKSFIDVGKEVESLQVRFKFLFGSVDEGATAFDNLTKFAARVPFSLDEISRASGNLAVVAKDATDLNRVLEITGNVAAVTGLDFETTSSQIQRAFSGGIGAADLFRERGVRALLGFQAGAKVTAEETIARFEELFSGDGQFANATKDLATTLEGTLSMIGDKYFKFQKDVAAGFFDELKGEFGDLNEFLEANEQQIKDIATAIGENFAGALTTTSDLIKNVAPAVKNISDALGTSIEGFKSLPTFVQSAGLIAALLFGKKGAVAFTAVSFLLGQMQEIFKEAESVGATGKLNFGDATDVKELNQQLDGLKRRRSELLADIQKNLGGEDTAFSLNVLNKSLTETDNQIKNITDRIGFLETFDASLELASIQGNAFANALTSVNNTTKDLTTTTDEFVKTNQNSAGAFSLGQAGAKAYNDELREQERLLNIVNTELGRFAQHNQDNSELIDSLNEAKFPKFVKALQDAGDTTMQLDTLFTNTFNNFADTLADALMTGKANFKDFARSVIADIARIIAKQQAMAAIQKALGFFGVSSIGGVSVDTIFGGKSAGGRVNKGMPYMVGEAGSEIFVPQQSGTIIPNNKMGGMNINFTINTVDARGVDELLTSRRNTIVNVINDALNRQGKEALV